MDESRDSVDDISDTATHDTDSRACNFRRSISPSSAECPVAPSWLSVDLHLPVRSVNKRKEKILLNFSLMKIVISSDSLQAQHRN